ncbi:MAG TPA: primosomal protein N' [Gammaproteobacteria bacterium]|nr:primosomal protein N' [Gammaproteobacteria bacterium]
MSTARYLRVAVPSPLYRHFDYLPPSGTDPAALTAGVRVRVPFGGRRVVGVLLDTPTHTEVAASKLKRAQGILDDAPLIPADTLALAHWAADYYRHPLGEVMQVLLPTALRQGRAAEARGTEVWGLTHAGRDATAASLRRAPRQAALLAYLQQQTGACEATRLDALDAGWRAPMHALLKRGWVEKRQRVSGTDFDLNMSDAAVTLNPEQRAAVRAISEHTDGFRAWLLNGVTSSGKTEVYLETIAATLRAGRQALVLVPEIGLTPQLLARFRARFGAVAAFHSGLSDSERLTSWLAARDGRARVVIGTRSAVFVPLQRPGIIVVDEEHDASFKQQDGFRYSARDLAVVRARLAGIPVLLGSATPSLESLHNVNQRRYTQLLLPKRAGSAQHPSLRLLDIRSRPLEAGLSDLLLDAMRRHLAADGQILLFLNRRGYAPTVMCHACGAAIECRRCDARMTLHANGRLQCHHCGAQGSLPAHCTHCGAAAFEQFGQGTERIEAALAQLFPQTGVARIDRDSTRRKGALETLLAGVQDGRHRILVGTQMLAKGHDFPNVTLAAILDADQGLFGVDFRAGERMAQLVMQVAGRAGRAERPGEVLIQTHHPEHPLLRHLVREGYASFAAAALAERRLAGLPPCSFMALLRAEAPNAAAPRAFLDAARPLLAAACGADVEVLGPVPAPMERRAGRYRAQLMLLARRRAALQAGLADCLPQLQGLKPARRVRWSLDVDPAETY